MKRTATVIGFLCPALLALSATTTQVNAATISYDLLGAAGAGLLPGNEPGTIIGGTGGEIGAGISLDDVTNILTINVGWGSGNGPFTDLSSNVSNQHIHGPTTAAFGFNGVDNGLGRSSVICYGAMCSGGRLSFPAKVSIGIFHDGVRNCATQIHHDCMQFSAGL